MLVVDNLLSSERENLPDDPRVELLEASIADDEVLASLEDEFDVVFHLATYHGNQSSIANPLEDHENNLITTLKLYERLKDFRRLRQGRLLRVGLHARATRGLRRRRAGVRGRTGSPRPRQPVPDLEGRRRVLLGLLPPAARAADGAGAVSERLRPRRGPRRRPLARHAGDRLAQRHADVRLSRAEGPAAAARQRRRRLPRLRLRRGRRARPDRLRRARRARATSTTSPAASRRRSATSPS